MKAKSMICALLALSLALTLCACANTPETPQNTPTDTPTQTTPAQNTPSDTTAEEDLARWTRAGYFTDEAGNLVSITWMEDVDEPGWYVGAMLGEDLFEDSWNGMADEEDGVLSGTLTTYGSKGDITVTVTEDGADGIALRVEGGETYRLTKYEMPQATIFVNIDTEGWGGMIAYAAGEETPEIDPEWPYQSAVINLAEPEIYTFAAAPEAGYLFIKWLKNGADYSAEPIITLILDESADYTAVFEEDPDWQNPVMNFIGEYQSGRARATVECWGMSEAWITIEWGSSAWELARWDIVGELDLDTLSIDYWGVAKYIVTYDDSGEIVSQEPEYEDGTGTITFNYEDNTFTWHDDKSEYGADMVFEWSPAAVGRADGERFETTIMLEGMDETVRYEHTVNADLGFEMDYDYEQFTHKSEAGGEVFVSVWDTTPENYLEIRRFDGDADAAADAVRAELSREYELLESDRYLLLAGDCLYIEGSVIKGTNNMADLLRMVYVIPASDGAFIADIHVSVEAAEGFGRRFNYMLQTFSILN